MNRARILIVEDELIARENLDHVLRKEGYDTVAVESGQLAFQELEKGEFDLVMTDLRMQQVDGLQVLERTKELYPDTEVIMITGYATVSTAVEAMQKGAYHYLPKPYKIEEVRILVRKALEKRWLRQEVTDLKRQVQSQKGVPLLIGKSPQIEALKSTIQQIAPTDATVLILGETGTGKELVAKAIHHLSLRAEKRFLAINCGAFSEELLANELFGHEREAFTGARGVKKGLLEAAPGGTIFLDEIGDMPLSMQVKLLRVLQEKTLIRVGGTTEIPGGYPHPGRHQQGPERGGGAGGLPPGPLLPHQRGDPARAHPGGAPGRHPPAVPHFLQKFATAQGKQIDKISDEVMDVLLDYEFPGNIRELENIMERAVTLAAGPTIEVSHLPLDFQQPGFQVQRRQKKEFLTLEENEQEYIAWVLKQMNGNKTKAAEVLGIDRVSLWRKLKRLDSG